MKRILLLLAAVAVCAAAGIVYFMRRSPAPAVESGADHRAGIDRQYAPLVAMAKAPEGKTPCETAFNGFRAYEDTPREPNFERAWGALPAREVFLQRCARFPEGEQLCLSIRYSRSHRECEPILERIFKSRELFD